MWSGYLGRGFYLEGPNQFTMLFNEQSYFAPVVGAPEIKSRFTAQVVEVSVTFQDFVVGLYPYGWGPGIPAPGL